VLVWDGEELNLFLLLLLLGLKFGLLGDFRRSAASLAVGCDVASGAKGGVVVLGP